MDVFAIFATRVAAALKSLYPEVTDDLVTRVVVEPPRDPAHGDLSSNAAMVVAKEFRGQGIGAQLVRALLAEAQRLGFATVYFGTDGPSFYERIGAVKHEHVSGEFFIMRFELAGQGAV